MPNKGTGSWSGARRSFPPRTARHILHRDQLCQLAYDGCLITATQADHIVPHAEATLMGWPPTEIDSADNGQGVCSSCHATKTRHEQQRGRKRRAARARRPPDPHPGLH
jgi:5-methylcytosine-specific restriction endonuclease McrA